MKFFLRFIFILVFFLISGQAYADEKQDQIESAVVATNIFKKVCFMMQSGKQQEKRREFLDSKFQKFDDQKKNKFLNFVRVETGDAWAAVFPKGNFTIIVDDKTQNCHVLAQQADDRAIHDGIMQLSDEAKKNLKGVDVIYNAPSDGSSLMSSGFDIKDKQGKNLSVIVASTPKAKDKSKPEAIMTLAVQ